MRRLIPFLSWAYLIALFAFILLPVAVLVLFSFQDGALPIPPFNGFTLKWYAEVFADDKLMAALRNSLVVAFGSSLVACVLGFFCRLRAGTLQASGVGISKSAFDGPDDCQLSDHRTGFAGGL